METIISVAQIAISVIVIILILLQQRDTDISGFLGGGGGGGGAFYQQRRGLERVFFISTIILTALFGILAVISLVISPELPNLNVTPAETASSTTNTLTPGSVSTGTLPLEF